MEGEGKESIPQKRGESSANLSLYDRWQCGICGEIIFVGRSRRPASCTNPSCKSRVFIPLSSPYIYFEDDRFVPKKLANEILNEYHIVTHAESKVIYRYNEGIYVPDGEELIRKVARQKLDTLARRNYIEEVVAHIREITVTDVDRFHAPPHLICLKNGVLDLKTKQLLPHSPELIFLQKLDITYNPAAKCPNTVRRLLEWTGGDVKNVIRIIQFIGFCLHRDYFIRKALIIHGEGGNGKSTFIRYLQKLLGEGNIASVPVQQLDKSFTRAELLGKLANLVDDLPSATWFSTGEFKQLTGDSPVIAEFKFRNPFTFRSYAKMLFTANRLPAVNDDTEAFWSRIIIVTFPRNFTSNGIEVSREKILEELLAEDEKSGMLNLALLGLESLLSELKFFREEDIEQTRNQYLHLSDPIQVFVSEFITPNPSGIVPKSRLYEAYAGWAKSHNFPVKENNAFARALKRVLSALGIHIGEGRHTIDGKVTTCWEGINLCETSDLQGLQGLQGSIFYPDIEKSALESKEITEKNLANHSSPATKQLIDTILNYINSIKTEEGKEAPSQDSQSQLQPQSQPQSSYSSNQDSQAELILHFLRERGGRLPDVCVWRYALVKAKKEEVAKELIERLLDSGRLRRDGSCYVLVDPQPPVNSSAGGDAT